jgi:hypothetical protein
MATRKRSGKKSAPKAGKKRATAKKRATSKKAAKSATRKGTTAKTKGAAKKSAAGKSVAKKGAAKKSTKKVSTKKPAARKGTSRSATTPTEHLDAASMAGVLTTTAHFPGFDTGSYPGDNVMDHWFGNPYVFTGYYLEAPCHNSSKFRPWTGHRETLKQIGWGFIVLYVGRQGSGCGSGSLTRAQGLADASDAISKAQADGMPDRATIFLDVERMETLSADLIRYMRGWLAGILQDGSYKPGIYAHIHNATDLFNEAQKEYAAQGQPSGAPAFWVVRVPGDSAFNVNTSSPQDLNNFPSNPISFANVWQGKIDIGSESHGGVTFGPVDQNVADTNNPSNV